MLYINDFSSSAPGLDFHLFADDSNLFCQHKTLQALEIKIDDQLHTVNEWLCANRLSLNIEKSNFVIFHPPQKKVSHAIDIKISNKTLKEQKSVKSFGVVLDSNLNWRHHIDELTNTIFRSIGVLCKLRHFVPLKLLFDYFSIPYLWYSDMGKYLSK